MADTCTHLTEVEPVSPSSEGCEDCLRIGDRWVHLRMCQMCGHVGCCDSSPNKHATAHHRETGHPIVRSFEPGEEWFFDYRTSQMARGPDLAPPLAHPTAQPVPGPADRVPEDWEAYLN
jgi:Zn-finger in ubiquitin-hydrolases and other protein